MDDFNLVLQKLHFGEITSCDFNVNFVLALGLSDRTVRILEWKRGAGFVDKFFSPLCHHKYSVTTVKFSPKGNLLASSSLDGTAVLIEIHTGTKIFTMVQYNSSNIKFCDFTCNSSTIMTAAEDGVLCFWDIAHYKETRRCHLHEEDYSLRTIDVTTDSEYLMSLDSGDLLRLWYIGDFENDLPHCLLQKKNIHDDVLCCVFSPVKNISADGDTLKQIYSIATCGGKSFVNIWQIIIERFKNKINPENFNCNIVLLFALKHDSNIFRVVFDHSGKYLVSIGFGGTVKFWNVHDKKCLKTLQEHKKYVTCSAFSKNTVLLATGSIDKTLIIWNLTQELKLDSELLLPCNISTHFTRVNTMNYHNKSTRMHDNEKYMEFTVVQKLTWATIINTVQFHSNNSLVVGGGGKTVEVWTKAVDRADYELKDVLKEHNFSINALDISHTGNKVISCSTDGITHWDLNINVTYKLTSAKNLGSLRACKFSRDSKFVAAGGDDQKVYLWDANKLEFIREMQWHENAVTAIAFTPDTKSLVSVCCGGSIIMQSLKHNSVEIRVNNAHDLGVMCCEFSSVSIKENRDADESLSKEIYHTFLLATGGNDSLVKLWKVTHSDIILSTVFTGHGGSINDIKFSNSKPLLLATCSNDSTVRITDTKTKQCLHVLNYHLSPVTTCSFSEDCSLLATGSLDKSVFITKLTPKSFPVLQKNIWNTNLLLEKWTTSDIVKWFLDIGCIDLADKINLTKLNGIDLFKINNQSIENLLNWGSEKLQRKFIQKITSLKQLMSFPSDILLHNANVPHKFLCPITHQLMKDPVICADGYTYDRVSLEEWFLGGKLISPITKECLSTTNLLPYSALKINIYKFLAENLSEKCEKIKN